MEINKEDLFTKPSGICKELNSWEKSLLLLEKADFAKAYKENIQAEINSFDLRLRMAELKDIDPVYDFIITCYSKEYLEDVSKYDIFRFIEYGHGLIIENEDHQILGCLFEVTYEKEHKKRSNSIRIAIDESLKGKGLGRLLVVYSCLLAMENGSQVKIALISLTNYISIGLSINKLGWLIDKYYDNLGSLGLSFESIMPLTPEALLLNRIELDKVRRYIAEHQEGIDYLLIRCDDVETIKSVYQNRLFMITAIICLEPKTDNPVFFALPVTQLYV